MVRVSWMIIDLPSKFLSKSLMVYFLNVLSKCFIKVVILHVILYSS
jgi:hypothetical protein